MKSRLHQKSWKHCLVYGAYFAEPNLTWVQTFVSVATCKLAGFFAHTTTLDNTWIG